MAHYAFLDENNLVTQVITGRHETETVAGISDWEEYYGSKMGQRCIRTSFSGSIRKNFAGIGFFYDEVLDVFIPPQPYESWGLNQETCQWESPIAYPTDGKNYQWDESTVNWVEVQGE